MSCEDEIRRNIQENYEAVMESSRKNIRYVSQVIDQLLEKEAGKKKILDYRNPDKYLGPHVACRKGYAADASIRENAASGGMVTALLCHLLKTGQIDGAWVTKTEVTDGKLGYRTYIAVTEEEIRDASSSVYMNIPLLKHVDLVRNFEGRVAVVMTPCMLAGLTRLMEKETALRQKIVLETGAVLQRQPFREGHAAVFGTVEGHSRRGRKDLLPQGPLEGPICRALPGRK